MAVVTLGALYATGAPAADNGQTFIGPKDVKWGPAPPTLPAGAQMAVLHGDPGKSGPFVVRLMTPGGYRLQPHWHSQDEALTVISGTLYLGMGDHYDPGTARGLAAGGFHFLPAKAHHYAFAKKPTVVQITGNGPFDITYINPADDPQKAKP
jgi:quercetin dioxygenase-like cupin family protein